MSKTRNDKKQQRQKDAIERQSAHDKLTKEEKIAKANGARLRVPIVEEE